MLHKIFPVVALAVSAVWSSMSFAQEPPAATQCVALTQQDRISEAELHCAKAAEEAGKFGKLLYADFLARQGDADGAVTRYSEILAGVDLAKPDHTEYLALRNRALIGFRLGHYSAGDDAHAALNLVPDDIELLRAAAYSPELEGRRIDYADRLVAVDPRSVEAHVLRSYALAANGKIQKAVDAAETASKLDSNSPLPQIARGYAYSMRGEFAKAEREYAAAARKAPNETEPRVSQAEMLAALKRHDEAIEAATAALRLRPDQPHALRLRASARLWMGDAAGALADAAAANKIDPHGEGSNLQITAEAILEAQQALQPGSIASLERDRQTVLAGIREHMHRACGHYTVPTSYEDTAGLNEYRACIEAWYDTEVDDLQGTVGRDVLEAASRFEATAELVDVAESLQCSKLPRKARCVPDSLYAHALAVCKLPDPRGVVGVEEFQRLNKEVMAYNTSIKRRNSLANTRPFPTRPERG